MQDLAKEQGKIPALRRKIDSANSAIKRTQSSSTIQSKLREIERAEKSISDSTEKCGKIQDKISKRSKELTDLERRIRLEEDRETKRKETADKRRQQENVRQLESFAHAMQEHEIAQARMQLDIERLKAVPKKINILLLAANPIGTDQLRLDEEVRSIQEKIRLSEHRDSIHFESRWAVRPAVILQAINETKPTIVHFSGHGADTGEIVLENDNGGIKFVEKEAISAAISTLSDTVRLVVFNACFSENQAEEVAKYIDIAIGMNDSIPDDTARIFAAQLYSSIGFGYSVEKSFKQAIAAILLEGVSGDTIPQIHAKDGILPEEIILVNPNSEHISQS